MLGLHCKRLQACGLFPGPTPAAYLCSPPPCGASRGILPRLLGGRCSYFGNSPMLTLIVCALFTAVQPDTYCPICI